MCCWKWPQNSAACAKFTVVCDFKRDQNVHGWPILCFRVCAVLQIFRVSLLRSFENEDWGASGLFRVACEVRIPKLVQDLPTAFFHCERYRLFPCKTPHLLDFANHMKFMMYHKIHVIYHVVHLMNHVRLIWDIRYIMNLISLITSCCEVLH